MRKIAIVALLAIAGALLVTVGVHKLSTTASLQQVPGYVDEAFQTWMKTHEKVYATPQELNYRRNVFLQNYFVVLNHNKKQSSFKTALNLFADLTHEEFIKKYTGLRVPQGSQKRTRSLQTSGLTQVPTSFDWRTKGVVNPIQNQGSCGSCWAFSATSAIESAWALSGKALNKLAEQQMVDCSSVTGNEGCNGGWMDWAFEYIINAGGQELSTDYPYTAKDGVCKFAASKVATKISTYYDVPLNECSELQKASLVNPVAVAIDVIDSFQLYKSGIYSDPKCGTDLNHAVTVVGYNIVDWTTSNQSYWIVRNSWGTKWGEQGYIRMDSAVQSPEGNCGICMVASYPIV